MITVNKIRRSFVTFFESKGHKHVPSAPLVPVGDDTILFTVAGMVPFKDVFLGTQKKPYTRAVTSQKCLRAGGKHNDLENVGYTARHQTFFEMLGNFSFGDYFKREAIHYAWEYLTVILKLPKEKLWITVFEEDIESEKIWLDDIGIDLARLSRIGAKDNFWAMGDTGPCGPCTEIFYDHGSEVEGGPPGSPDEDGDRYIEIWNLVFMEYNRQIDGTLEKLAKPSVDTGMGLERLAAVLQHVHSNYEIDLFQSLINSAADIIGTNDLEHASLRVVADHIRACSFLIIDGVLPSNEGRGYVLRRIIRRAVRHGNKLGAQQAFLYRLVEPLVGIMKEGYPDLAKKRTLIESTLKKEEQQFEKTLANGLKMLEANIQTLPNNEIIGELAFKLYDTYGFPLDLTADIARERGLTISESGFQACMEEQKKRAKSASKFGVDYNQIIKTDVKTTFLGYAMSVSDAVVLGLYQEGQKVEALSESQKGVIVLDQTPFYAESGGQMADKGLVEACGAVFEVTDVQKIGHAFLHFGVVKKGVFKQDDEVTASISPARKTIAAHHTATHLLHAALREIIGNHVEQKGSFVEAGKLRFDFSNASAVTSDQIIEIERRVNQIIRQNILVETVETTPESASCMGAMALFGEKYGEVVRVLRIGDFSVELCGGTHVLQTGEIGLFKIISESGVASGVRRIEAVVGRFAEKHIEDAAETLNTIHELLKSNDENVLDKLLKLQHQFKLQEKVVKQLKTQLISGNTSEIEEQEIEGISIISAMIPGADMGVLREKIDQYKSQKSKIIAVLSTENNGKAKIAVGVSKALTSQFKAGELANFLAHQVDGKGGGRPDMAQAGGNKPQNLPAAMSSVQEWVQERIL